MKKGKLNKISDVEGVSVGHCTIDDGIRQTGVTVINPCDDNAFYSKLQAATYVINGFGKTVGLMQIDEIGLLESPIALTNTLSVGRVQDALVRHMIEECSLHKKPPLSINTVVGECNDARINDIHDFIIEKQHVDMAFENACSDFDLGSVGAGRGMVAYGLKAGIGSASRVAEYRSGNYTVGVLSLCNHGRTHQLMIDGKRVGIDLKKKILENLELEKGSIVIIIATDAPLSARQLKRLSKRATAGIARTGSEFGNGSGDVVISFSTKNRVPDYEKKEDIVEVSEYSYMSDYILDDLFTASIEAVEESIYSALYSAETVGKYKSLSELSK